MKVPTITPIGLVEYPDGYTASPRRLPVAIRVLAASVLVIFALTVVATTVVSVGSYCLTSNAGDKRNLHLPTAQP